MRIIGDVFFGKEIIVAFNDVVYMKYKADGDEFTVFVYTKNSEKNCDGRYIDPIIIIDNEAESFLRNYITRKSGRNIIMDINFIESLRESFC